MKDMHSIAVSYQAPKPVQIWLWVLAGFVLLMVGVGGATRLTGSGLSITEWRPVTGAIPPFSHEAWIAEFEKYRQIPQYQLLNKGMSLADFQFIYAWEWGHRQLGRLIGLVFFLPLIWFGLKGMLTRRLIISLGFLGVLGGLQAAIGWIMVASGLKPGMVAVAPIKLMLHLTVASLIFAGLIWLAANMRPRPAQLLPEVLRRSFAWQATGLVALIFVQIALGALVAGSKAGWSFNTWPLMDGAFIPPISTLFAVQPWIENFIDNVALVQFNHRIMAYVVVSAALLHMGYVLKKVPSTLAARNAVILAVLCFAQMVLGIVTLLLQVPLWAGLAHQVLAFVLLGASMIHRRFLRPS
jgi:heme a synthase